MHEIEGRMPKLYQNGVRVLVHMNWMPRPEANLFMHWSRPKIVKARGVTVEIGYEHMRRMLMLLMTKMSTCLAWF